MRKANQTQPATFADISRLLITEILHLREALSFYELQIFERESDAPAVLAAPQCGDAHCSALQLHFDFCAAYASGSQA